MVKHEGSSNLGDAGDVWLRALGEDANEAAPQEDERAIYPGIEDEQAVATDNEAEQAVDYSDDATEMLRQVHDENNSASFERNPDALDLLQEAYEGYDAKTLDSLEAAEKDQKESFWRKAGSAVTKVYRKLIGLATGRKIETSAESAEATKEVIGKVGKKAYEVTEKLVKAGAAAATQTVMTNMGLGGE